MTASPAPTHRAPALVLPTDARFDEARQAWNLAVDQRPAAVAFAESEQDVSAAVVFAAEQGYRIAPQGTGHNAGPLGSLEDTILLKTERMRSVRIDPQGRIARVPHPVDSCDDRRPCRAPTTTVRHRRGGIL